MQEKLKRYDKATGEPLKRFIADIPEALHIEIAILARRRGLSITKYIQHVMLEELKREYEYYAKED